MRFFGFFFGWGALHHGGDFFWGEGWGMRTGGRDGRLGGWERGGGGAVAQSPLRDAFTFRVAAGVEWGAMERARAQWRGHLGTLKLL